VPYKKISELPDTVKVLPIQAQKMWMRVFNRAIHNPKYNEETAFKVAWSVVKQFYKKNKDGKWVKRKNK